MKARLVLHRKLNQQHKCICGSPMIYHQGALVCEDQLESEEPSWIDVDRGARLEGIINEQKLKDRVHYKEIEGATGSRYKIRERATPEAIKAKTLKKPKENKEFTAVKQALQAAGVTDIDDNLLRDLLVFNSTQWAYTEYLLITTGATDESDHIIPFYTIGDKVKVHLVDTNITGKITSSNNTELVVRENGNVFVIQNDKIVVVEILEHNTEARNLLLQAFNRIDIPEQEES